MSKYKHIIYVTRTPGLWLVDKDERVGTCLWSESFPIGFACAFSREEYIMPYFYDFGNKYDYIKNLINALNGNGNITDAVMEIKQAYAV